MEFTDWVGTSKPKKCHEGVPGFSGGFFRCCLTLSSGLGLACGKLRSPNTWSQCWLLGKCCDAPSETQVKHQKGRGEDRKCFNFFFFLILPSGINLPEWSHSAVPKVTPGKMSLESKGHYQGNNNNTWGCFPGGELFVSH